LEELGFFGLFPRACISVLSSHDSGECKKSLDPERDRGFYFQECFGLRLPAVIDEVIGPREIA